MLVKGAPSDIRAAPIVALRPSKIRRVSTLILFGPEPVLLTLSVT